MKKKLLSLITTLMLVFTMGGVNTFAAEKITPDTEEPVTIGTFDGKLIDYMDPNDPMAKVVSNVRINSYATYDKSKGIKVTTKLYVPATSYPKPQFTSMVGAVAVKLNGKTTTKPISKVANGTPTIEASVSTGVTGKTGNKGTITVSGNATSRNALDGGGNFGISYPVTIP